MKIKEYFKNQRGMSLIEIIISGALITAGSLLVFKSKGLLNESKDSQERVFSIQSLNDDLVATASRILTGVEDEKGNRVKGLCSIVKTNSTSYGIGEIYADLNVVKNIFSKNVWESNFINWKITSDSRCNEQRINKTTSIFKCFAFSPQSIMTGISENERLKMNIVASVEIIPVGINPYKSGKGMFYDLITSSTTSTQQTRGRRGRGNIVVSEERIDNIDVKNVAFKINSKVFYSIDKQSNIKELKDIVWLPSVGTCDGILADGKSKAALSLSALGLSDPTGRTVYNRAGFKSNKDDPVKFIWRRDTAQAGLLLPSNFIKTNPERNIYGSCNETSYRCPQTNPQHRSYGPIDLRVDLALVQNSILGQPDVLNVKPHFMIRKGDGASIVNSSDISMLLDSSRNIGQAGDISLIEGHNLEIKVQDSSGGNNTLCRQICKNPDYNTGGSIISENYTPWLKLTFPNYKGYELTSSSNQSFGCTACYMKNCSQFGLGTFGPMSQMPSQPQDSSVPECHRFEPNSRKVFDPLYNYRFNVNNGDNSSKCIKAKVSGERLIYEAENCNSSLPVMCYNFGKFRLAQNVLGSGQGLSKVMHKDAIRRCFETGREVSSASDLQEFMGTSQINLPIKNGQVDFINLANQGSFIAPQLDSDFSQFQEWLRDSAFSADRTWFWIAMSRDSKKSLGVLPPLIPALGANDAHALYYSPARNLVSNSYSFGHGLTTDSGSNVFMLSHHIKFRGLIPVRKYNPSSNTGRQFPFVCRKKSYPGKIFISSMVSSAVRDGKEACGEQDGLFLPPNSLTQWIYTYNLLNPFHSNYSFPSPSQGNAQSIPLAWVALETTKPTVSELQKARLPSNIGYKPLGKIKYYDPKRFSGDHFLINGDGHFINPRIRISGNNISENRNVNLPPGAKITYELKPYGKKTLILNSNPPLSEPKPGNSSGGGNLNKVGDWDANSNSPSLSAGKSGDYYEVTVAGSADPNDPGNSGGALSWDVGDRVVWDNPGKIWVKGTSQPEFDPHANDIKMKVHEIKTALVNHMRQNLARGRKVIEIVTEDRGNSYNDQDEDESPQNNNGYRLESVDTVWENLRYQEFRFIWDNFKVYEDLGFTSSTYKGPSYKSLCYLKDKMGVFSYTNDSDCINRSGVLFDNDHRSSLDFLISWQILDYDEDDVFIFKK